MTTPLRALSSSSIAAVLAFGVIAVTYIATMSRTYGFIDRGELAAVASSLGIAHPTGYPTLTLLGHLAVGLFPGVRPVLTLNVLSALWTATAVALAALLVHRVLRSTLPAGSGTQDPRKASARKARSGSFPLAAASFFSATFVGLSTTWWSQAAGFEVYSLHAVFLTLVTLLFLRYLEDLDSPRGRARFSRWGILFSLSLGLSFTNHLSTVMLAPAFFFLFFRSAGLSARTLRELVRLVPAFAAGLLPYAYLPLRAAMHPRLDWGNPDTLERFLEHVTGAQFHFAVLFETRIFRQQTEFFVKTLLSDTSLIGLAVAAFGLLHLARRGRVHALSTGILFLTCAVVSGLYDINDIGNYYLPAFVAVAIWVAAGIAFAAERFGGIAGCALGALLVGLNAGRHYHPMNERHNTLAEDLTWNVLQNLPPRSVVISGHWDYWVSGSLYAQEIEGLRRDVLVLDPEGLRSETYLVNLKRNEPELWKPVENETRAFIDWIREFRKSPTMPPVEVEAYYTAYYSMISALIERTPDRPFFVTEWTDPRIAEGYHRVPTKLAYRLTEDPTYLEQSFPEYRFRPWRNRVDPYVVKVSEIYTASLLSRARYEEEHGRLDEARRYGLSALGFDPGFSESEVPDLPLHIEDQIVEVLRSYAALRERVRRDAQSDELPVR